MTRLRGLLVPALVALGLLSLTFLVPSGLAQIAPALTQNPILSANYLPLVFQLPPSPVPTNTPEATAVPTATSTATATATTTGPQPTATPAPLPPSLNACRADPNADIAPNYPVRIVSIDKVAESVRLQNVSAASVDLSGWTMCSITGNQTHIGIGGSLAPGEARSFPYTGPGNIWNNTSRDDGALYNPGGSLVSYFKDL